jgi:hypothetical protein
MERKVHLEPLCRAANWGIRELGEISGAVPTRTSAMDSASQRQKDTQEVGPVAVQRGIVRLAKKKSRKG